MRPHLPKVVAASLLSGIALLFGARAAAFFDVGGDAILADLLGNSLKQLAAANDAVTQLRQSNSALKQIADDRAASASGARTFQGFAANSFGSSYSSEVDAASPSPAQLRKDAFDRVGVGGSTWILTRGACGDGRPPGPDGCPGEATPGSTAGILGALDATFGSPSTRRQESKVVDAETAVAIEQDALQDQVEEIKKARIRELVKRCSKATNGAGDAAARALAEQCSLASELSQVLHLEEGQQTNLKLTQVARLQALSVAQRNAELKREMAEEDARRVALTSGLDRLTATGVSIRTGSAAF